MRAFRGAYGAAGIVLFLAACGGSDEPRLMNLRATGNGPDEFAILPTKPLQMPATLNDLPVPTPGGHNLTDPTPEADAIVALGGNPAAGASDGALVAYAARNGTDAGIRATLAAEDLEFRRNNNGRLLERLIDANVYYRVYEPQSLDKYSELERWRRAGAGNPSAPPVLQKR